MRAGQQTQVAVPLLVAAGVAGVIGIASLNIAAQSLLPDWIRGRGLAVLQVAFQGTFAVGAAVWGTLAQNTSISTSMSVAAAVLAASTLLGLRFRLSAAEHVDAVLAAGPEAFVLVTAAPEDGPVQIRSAYMIPASRRARHSRPARPSRVRVATSLSRMRDREPPDRRRPPGLGRQRQRLLTPPVAGNGGVTDLKFLAW